MAATDPAPADHAAPGRHAASDAGRAAASRPATQAHDRSWLVLLAGAIVTLVLYGILLAVTAFRARNAVALAAAT